jgi:Xaa-Pro aminopeptidase
VLYKNGGTQQEILFLPKRSPQFETWNGRMYSNEDATRLSGLKTIVDAREWESFYAAVKDKKAFAAKEGGFSFAGGAENVYLLTIQFGFQRDNVREYAREWKTANEFAKVTNDENTNMLKYEPLLGYKVLNATPIFAKLRAVKSPYEIKLMQHAIDITTEAQGRALATAKQVKWEYETQAEIEYVFRRRNADYWGYPSIVGCGPNATTLHYVESQGEVKPGELLLMDVGAEYDHYTADVTRTFPVNGKFSREQAEIYQIVYDAQEAAAKTMKPGGKFGDPNAAARQTVEQGLVKLGLITEIGAVIPGTEREIPDGQGGKRMTGTPQSFLWFMHGLGHWLGMNVHDVGGGGQTVFQPGMIMTNEPGVYIRGDALDYFDLTKPEVKAFVDKIRPAFEKYKNIGVRIEDDMLITPTGVEWMTKELPRKISEIEDFMAKASKEITVAGRGHEAAPRMTVLGAETDLLRAADLSLDLHPHGRTVRRGWVYAGVNTAYSALDHPHAE